MGIGIFGKSCLGDPSNVVAVAPNPSPTRWKMLNKTQYENSYVLTIRYLDCTNFEGVKIIVYRGQYEHIAVLDPHFKDESDSPIARFKPTQEGISLAHKLAASL
jgi:hypothetical protein